MFWKKKKNRLTDKELIDLAVEEFDDYAAKQEEQNNVDCDKHGERVPSLIYAVSRKELKRSAKFCFFCMTDFLEKNLTNYNKEGRHEQ